MKEIILTVETAQQIVEELDKYDIIMSVVEEDDRLGKDLGPGLFDLGIGEPGSTFYPADGTITFIFDDEKKEVFYNRVSHD